MADIIFTVIIIAFTLSGRKRGLVKTLLSFVSTLISLFFSNILYRPVSVMIANSFFGDMLREIAQNFIQNNQAYQTPDILSGGAAEALTQISSNVTGFVTVLVVVKSFLAAFSRIINSVVKLPVIKQANKLLGAAFGFLGGLLLCGIIISVVKWGAEAGLFTEAAAYIEQSVIADIICRTVNI